jgi:hypothetical protein
MKYNSFFAFFIKKEIATEISAAISLYAIRVMNRESIIPIS